MIKILIKFICFALGYTFTLSNLVAYYFIRKIKQDEKVIHIDKNIRNNYVKNLKIIN